MRHILYRVFDGDTRLLYVGATVNPSLRFPDHSRAQTWWDEVANITLEHFSNGDELYAAEIEAIQAEDPKYNWIHNQPLPWTRRGGRRKRGEGTVFQRGDGYWVAGVYTYGADGKRKSRRFVSSSREVAVSKMEAFKRAQADANG